MRSKNTLISATLLVLAMLGACASHKPNRAQSGRLAYLFSSAKSIKVLSYTNRTYVAPLIEEEDNISAPKDTSFLVADDLRIATHIIKETLTLNGAQADLLYRLLEADVCEKDEVAMCYEPRHAILFCDSTDHPFGYIEVCFDCTNYQTSDNFQLDFCPKKSQALKNLLQSFGISYFGPGEF